MVESIEQNRFKQLDKHGSAIEIDRKLVRLGHLMDTMFRVPVLGWRFGMNTVIDLVPGIGDTATSVISLYILVSAVRYRVPKIALVRMGMNTAIYYVGGLVPLAGDLFDTWWKPNKRNLELLRRHATVSGTDARDARKSDQLFVGLIILLLFVLLSGAFVLSYLVLRFAIHGLNLPASY